jgi:zinc-ribbon domain
MAFFKDLGKKITEGVQDASEKASELVEVNKLNLAISKEKSAIYEVKKQIGEKIFAMYKAGETVPDTLSDELNIISTHLQTIAGFEAKISEIKGEPSTRQDESQMTTTPAPAAEEPNAAAGRFCANCGAKMVEGTAFCSECGQKA